MGRQSLVSAGDFSPFGLRQSLSPDTVLWLGSVLSGTTGDAPPASWEADLPAILTHGLGPLLHVHAGAGWPAALRDAAASAFRANAVRSALLEEQLGIIVAGLAGEGIPIMLLKGAALVRVVYGSAAERPVGDFDLLVPEGRAESAGRVLTTLGFAPVGMQHLGRWQRRYRAETAFRGVRPENRDLLVELHWSLLEIPYFRNRISESELWSDARPARALPGACVPGPEVLLLHACTHLAYHHSQDVRLFWLVDVDRLARRSELDWHRLIEFARRWRVGPALAATLDVTGRWLRTPVPAAVVSSLDELAQQTEGQALWGAGQDGPGLAARKAAMNWQVFSWPDRLRYGAWLGWRALMRPLESRARK